MKYNSFDELLRQALENKAKDEMHDNDYWYASELGTCLRKQFLRRLGLPGKKKQWRIIFTAEQGKAIHNWICEILKQSGTLITSEERLINENLKWKGRLDAIINLNTQEDPYLSLVDIKTQRSEAFFRRKREPNHKKVKEFQKKQLASYFFFALKKYPDLKDARIFYLDRGGGIREEFVFKFKKETWKEILDEINSLNSYWEKKQLPPCKHGWECKDLCDVYKKDLALVENGKTLLEEFLNKHMSRNDSR